MLLLEISKKILIKKCSVLNSHKYQMFVKTRLITNIKIITINTFNLISMACKCSNIIFNH